MPPRQLFEPQDLTQEGLDAIRAGEVLKGIPEGWMHWLVPGLRELRPFELSDVGEEEFDRESRQHLPPHDRFDRNLACLTECQARWPGKPRRALSYFLASAWTIYVASDEVEAQRRTLETMVTAAQSAGVDFTRVLRVEARYRHSVVAQLKHAQQRPGLIGLARGLRALGAVSCRPFLKPASIMALADNVGAFPKLWGSEKSLPLRRDPATLGFWLFVDVEAGIDAVVEMTAGTADEELPRLVKGALWAVGCWSVETKHHPERYSAKGPGLQRGAERLFRLLVTRAQANEHLLKNARFVESLYRTAWIAFDGQETVVGDDDRRLLTSLAKPTIAGIRSRLAKASKDEAASLLEAESDHIRAVAHSLYSLATLWDGMKALLLLVRASPIPIFADDLSWWTTKPPMANNGVANLANGLMFFFQSYARFEQNNDPELKGLRTGLAEYCIDRLKTDKKRDGPTEPDAIWREAAIRALGDLGVNPDGKGHRVLHHVMSHDDNERVRAAAEAVYPRVRENRGLPKDTSPRVAVLHALWWLRQAQLAALGCGVNQQRAAITRAEEIRYTSTAAT